MGNRANVHFVDTDIHVYLHWNGGIESVAAFLQHTFDLMDGRVDPQYFTARFMQVVGNFFGGNSSLGISSEFMDGKSYRVKIGNTVEVSQGDEYQPLSDIVESLKGDDYWTGENTIMELLQDLTPVKSAYTAIVRDGESYYPVRIESKSWDAHGERERKALRSASFSSDAKVIAITKGWNKVIISDELE